MYSNKPTADEAHIEIGDAVFEYVEACDMLEACAAKFAKLMKHDDALVRENAKDYLDAILGKVESCFEEVEQIHGDAQDE